MSTRSAFVVREKDVSGHLTSLYTDGDKVASRVDESNKNREVPVRLHTATRSWRQFLGEVFLPEGYPATVSEDYLEYQIYNALQAFCSSLASLFASRAVLQGHGVGDASASATNAILLTVLQDVCSRLTTIVGGYYLGTSLTPEAKTYRLLADILNDAAIISDTLSPYLAFVTLSAQYPFVKPGTNSSLRVVALCLSGAFRALCGAVAGGSKAALTVHFATDGHRPGDVGDLSAKDGSKETVLALLGMLCGSVVVHYVHSAQATYAVLFGLIFFHLAFNAMAVRVISMRYFNRQRASIAWRQYRSTLDSKGRPTPKTGVPTYAVVSHHEKIFTDSSWIDCGGTLPARVTLGATFALLRHPKAASESWLYGFKTRPRSRHDALSDAEVVALLRAFADEKYILTIAPASPARPLHVLVSFKEGHSARDHLKAWAHAHEVAWMCGGKTPAEFEARLGAVGAALESVARIFPGFVDAAKAAGWKVDEGALVGGSPVALSVELVERGGKSRLGA
ncbi:hypothetical protein GSI_15454 [Ganoderma sinense ZZ0214-1]|uniref:Protein root UVB sensitive/RUS domain-containing protein n=1 Tax=Ganoderma sinense ZZ0214-1 TaxID=1077348 RepID=A0A2G8RMM8_9APHY|nr:hypothetical protein GSI_15454 [Ganoderma sinense ZZ0214-1]